MEGAEGLDPRDVWLGDAAPLIDTFGRAELEQAAAMFVIACVASGGWRPQSAQEMARAARVARHDDGLPWLMPNPFFRPDFWGLADRGFVRIDRSEGGDVLTPLPPFFTALRLYVERFREWERRWRDAVVDWVAARRWEDDGGRSAP